MLKKLLLLVAVAFVGSFAYAQNTPETATVIDNLDTYEGTVHSYLTRLTETFTH